MKYFVISDVHGQYFKMISALKKAGFDEENPNHCLVSLGDNFDRGSESKEVYLYLKNLPNKVLLRGNHEEILLKAFARRQLTYTDYYNGVGKTIESLSGESEYSALSVDYAKKRNRGIIKWIKSMPFYLETKTHILTHGWVPTAYFYDEYLPSLDWFNSKHWIEATWAHTEHELELLRYAKEHNQLAPHALNKTLVIGHWHSFRLKDAFQGTGYLYDSQFNEYYDTSIYYDDKVPVVGIDGCSNASSGRVNVYTFEE